MSEDERYLELLERAALAAEVKALAAVFVIIRDAEDDMSLSKEAEGRMREVVDCMWAKALEIARGETK